MIRNDSIFAIQQRMAEQGRIRMGVKKISAKSGKSFPAKLESFRLTSPNERLIREIANLYGGDPEPWTEGNRREWQVITNAKAIPVIVVKGGHSLWYEQWSGGGMTRRCDGVDMQPLHGKPGGPCACAQAGRLTCKPKTRLSVMLRDVQTLGVFRLESNGTNAAAILPGPAELAAHFGDMVPATLHLVPRRVVSEGETKEFMVPVLDLEVSKQRLVAIAAAQAGQPAPATIEQAPAAPAIEAPRPDYHAAIEQATSEDDLRSIYETARASGHLDEQITAHTTERLASIRAEQGSARLLSNDTGPEDGAGEGAGDTVTGTDTPLDPDVDTIWYQVQMLAGRNGMTSSDLDTLVTRITGTTPAQCTVEQLGRVHDALTTGEVPA